MKSKFFRKFYGPLHYAIRDGVGRPPSGAIQKIVKENFMPKITIAIVVTGLLLGTYAFACSFDTDCEVGSKCVKKSGSIYGVCAGGMYPGNSNDREPVYAPLDLNNTYGDTCSFNTDCGPGSQCVKESGRIYGVCMKRR